MMFRKYYIIDEGIIKNLQKRYIKKKIKNQQILNKTQI